MDINSVKPVGPQVPKTGLEPGTPPGTPVEGLQVQLPGQGAGDAVSGRESSQPRLEEAVEKMNQTAQIFDRSLKFQIHEETNTMMVAVVDTNTNKVIREIPPKEILDMFARMQDYLGLIFDKKA